MSPRALFVLPAHAIAIVPVGVEIRQARWATPGRSGVASAGHHTGGPMKRLLMLLPLLAASGCYKTNLTSFHNSGSPGDENRVWAHAVVYGFKYTVPTAHLPRVVDMLLTTNMVAPNVVDGVARCVTKQQKKWCRLSVRKSCRSCRMARSTWSVPARGAAICSTNTRSQRTLRATS